MNKRKIVKSGNTSYTIALPIDWVRKNRLDKGSTLLVAENEVGEIIITSDKKHILPKDQIKTIKVDGKDTKLIYLELINAYLRDYSTIILEGKEIWNKEDNLTTQTRSFIGLDIIEQTSNSIVIKNFFSIDKETSSRFLLRKMDLGIRAMFQLTHIFFSSGFSKKDFFELKKLDEQNKRIYTLVRKVILKMIENPQLMRTFQASYHEISKEKIISLSLQRLSTIFVDLGKIFLYLEHTKKEIKDLKDFFSKLDQNYTTILNARRHKKYEDIFSFLNISDKYSNDITTMVKDTKNNFIIEALLNYNRLNQTLIDLSFEIIE